MLLQARGTRARKPSHGAGALVHVLVLFCLSSVDPIACTPSSALHRVSLPDTNVAQCAMAGQTAIAAQPDPIWGRQYIIVRCTRV